MSKHLALNFMSDPLTTQKWLSNIQIQKMEALSVYKLSFLIPLLIWSVQVDGRQPNKVVEVGLQYFLETADYM